MANFNLTDRGHDASSIRIELDANGDPRAVSVEVVMSDGGSRFVPLTRAEAAAALTATERQSVRSALPKLYAAAVAKAGGV